MSSPWQPGCHARGRHRRGSAGSFSLCLKHPSSAPSHSKLKVCIWDGAGNTKSPPLPSLPALCLALRRNRSDRVNPLSSSPVSRLLTAVTLRPFLPSIRLPCPFQLFPSLWLIQISPIALLQSPLLLRQQYFHSHDPHPGVSVPGPSGPRTRLFLLPVSPRLPQSPPRHPLSCYLLSYIKIHKHDLNRRFSYGRRAEPSQLPSGNGKRMHFGITQTRVHTLALPFAPCVSRTAPVPSLDCSDLIVALG